jgi:hypothetical protein
MPRPSLHALKRELAELREKQRAKLCTCGKSQADDEPRKGVHIFSPSSCAEAREDEAHIERLKNERCPAMHPDGDAEPVIISIDFYGCKDGACGCHHEADHGGCPTCDPGYFNKHRDPISGAFRLNAGQSVQGLDRALPSGTERDGASQHDSYMDSATESVASAFPAERLLEAAEPAGATQTAEVVPEPQHRPARAPALSLDGMTRDGMRRYRQSCVLCAHAPTEHVDGGQCTQCPCDAFRSNTALGVVLGLPNGQIRAGDMEIEMEVHKDGTR